MASYGPLVTSCLCHTRSAYGLKPRQLVVDIPDQESQNLDVSSTSSWDGRENLGTSLQEEGVKVKISSPRGSLAGSGGSSRNSTA